MAGSPAPPGEVDPCEGGPRWWNKVKHAVTNVGLGLLGCLFCPLVIGLMIYLGSSGGGRGLSKGYMQGHS
jgi:hypothetical protein